MASKNRILILDNNDSFTFNLVQLIEEAGISSYDVVESSSLDPGIVPRYDKVLISPGPGLPSDFPAMCKVIRDFGAEKDMLGICLGHQAIAEVFGASLLNLPHVKHGVTTKLKILIREEGLFDGIPDASEVGLYHSWTVNPASLPDCLEVTGVGDEQRILAIRHKSFKLRGVQFHPESFMTQAGKKMIENWLNR